MTDRERLIKLIGTAPWQGKFLVINDIADHLIANGVTFVTDNNVGGKWIPASEPPKEYGEYIVKIASAVRSTTLYYSPEDDTWEDDEQTFYNVTHWMPLPEPPKVEGEVDND